MRELRVDARAVTVRFSREGLRDGVPLARQTEYQVSVDGSDREVFQSPWDEDELDEVVTILRNRSEERAGIEKLSEIGRQIGDSLKAVTSFVQAVQPQAGNLTVYWQLDYPELARIPWEVTSWWRPPHDHILLTPGISFVRTVPLFDPGVHTGWPTGVKKELRLLFLWGDHNRPVPRDEHVESLRSACEANGVALETHEVNSVQELQRLYEDGPYDFVHLLAHGAAAPDGEWGVQLSEQVATGTQIARALRSGGVTPALVTLAACDSGNETDNRFGSVGYELHAHGVPMVLASQFRLRVSASNVSVAKVYKGLLAGDHPLEVLAGVRGQLSPTGTEAWANEVLYTKYTIDELNRGSNVARQQGALRRARALAERFKESPPDEEAQAAAKNELREQVGRLEPLADDGFDPAETYGLLGSLERRIAIIGASEAGPDDAALRYARDFYERGLRADLNSHYCGINALHLSWLIGDREKVAELKVVVAWAVQGALEHAETDFWAYASAGEAKVYLGEADAAAAHYRDFVRENRKQNDAVRQREALTAASRQLRQLEAWMPRTEQDEEAAAVSEAAAMALVVLDGAFENT